MTPIRPLIPALLLAAALSGLTACVLPSEDIDTTPDPVTQTPAYEFGDHYSLVQNDSMPRLDGDSLYVRLAYDCGGALIFLEHFKTAASAYEVWLNMPEGIRCAMPMVETRAFKVPDSVKTATSVKLVTPTLDRVELKN